MRCIIYTPSLQTYILHYIHLIYVSVQVVNLSLREWSCAIYQRPIVHVVYLYCSVSILHTTVYIAHDDIRVQDLDYLYCIRRVQVV